MAYKTYVFSGGEAEAFVVLPYSSANKVVEQFNSSALVLCCQQLNVHAF